MVDASTKKTLQNIPLLQTRASPRDKDLWVQRLKEEYQALIKVCFGRKKIESFAGSGGDSGRFLSSCSLNCHSKVSQYLKTQVFV